VGILDGSEDGTILGSQEGGTSLGTREGISLGSSEGLALGKIEEEGTAVGDFEGGFLLRDGVLVGRKNGLELIG